MIKSWKLALIGMISLVCMIVPMVFVGNAQSPADATEPPATDVVIESITPELAPPPKEEPTPEPSFDLPTVVKPPVERPKVEQVTSDIIKVNVKLYNEHSEGFNPEDGAMYIYDIAALLHKYAPEGMRISAGCAMAYTEGGSGKMGVYAVTNNCFGIRATPQWDGWVYARNQGIVYKDYSTAKANGGADFFCAYPTMEESVAHYVRLISGDYYNHAFTYDNDHDYLQYILSKGYGEAHLLDTWLYLIKMYNTTQYNF